MSRQYRQRERERLAAIAAAHEASPADAERIAERNLQRAERALVRVESTERRLAGTVYHATPYGKFFGRAKQDERDEKSRLRKEENRKVFNEGGFVSEANYVSYVKQFLLAFTDPVYDDMPAREPSRIHRYVAEYVGTLMDGIIWLERHARVKWGDEKAAMLTMRAERIVDWHKARDTAGNGEAHLPPEFQNVCSNARTALQNEVSRGIALRRKAQDSLADRERYFAWWRESYHVFLFWDELQAARANYAASLRVGRERAIYQRALDNLPNATHLESIALPVDGYATVSRHPYAGWKLDRQHTSNVKPRAEAHRSTRGNPATKIIQRAWSGESGAPNSRMRVFEEI